MNRLLELWKYIVHILANLPNTLGVDRKKQSDITSFHFWYRQLFHMLGGTVLSLSSFLPPYLPVATFSIMVVVITFMEVKSSRTGQPPVKGAIDMSAWILGFMLGAYLICLL